MRIASGFLLFGRPSAIEFFGQADDLPKQERQFLSIFLQPCQ
jgi:hypothetical protein